MRGFRAIGLTRTAPVMLGLAIAGFASPAFAQEVCPTREVHIYFEAGEDRVNAFSEAIAERIAEEARACPGSVVQAGGVLAPLSPQRSAALEDAFEGLGVRVIIEGSPSSAPRPGAAPGLLERSAGVRLTPPLMAAGY